VTEFRSFDNREGKGGKTGGKGKEEVTREGRGPTSKASREEKGGKLLPRAEGVNAPGKFRSRTFNVNTAIGIDAFRTGVQFSSVGGCEPSFVVSRLAIELGLR